MGCRGGWHPHRRCAAAIPRSRRCDHRRRADRCHHGIPRGAAGSHVQQVCRPTARRVRSHLASGRPVHRVGGAELERLAFAERLRWRYVYRRPRRGAQTISRPARHRGSRFHLPPLDRRRTDRSRGGRRGHHDTEVLARRRLGVRRTFRASHQRATRAQRVCAMRSSRGSLCRRTSPRNTCRSSSDGVRSDVVRSNRVRSDGD